MVLTVLTIRSNLVQVDPSGRSSRCVKNHFFPNHRGEEVVLEATLPSSVQAPQREGLSDRGDFIAVHRPHALFFGCSRNSTNSSCSTQGQSLPARALSLSLPVQRGREGEMPGREREIHCQWCPRRSQGCSELEHASISDDRAQRGRKSHGAAMLVVPEATE